MSKTIYITTKALRMILKKYCNLNLPINTKFVLTTEKEKTNEENYVLEDDKIEYTDAIKFVETSEPNIVAEEIEELKEELAQKESELERWKNLTNIYKETLKSKDKELAEKEEQLNSSQVGEEFALKCCDEVRNLLELQVSGQHQDKINFAIEQLEKVKEDILNYEDIYYQFLESGSKVPVVCVENYRVRQPIDNQIEELKKE